MTAVRFAVRLRFACGLAPCEPAGDVAVVSPYVVGDTPHRRADSRTAPQTQGRAERWLIHFGGRESIEVVVSPAVDLAQVLADYSDALAAEPAQTCRRCAHFAKPGLSDPGYCGAGLPGLERVYGALHALPADRGADCGEFIEVGP